MKLTGRTAAVTGASSGIGAAIAAALAAEGAAVLALARRFPPAAARPPVPGELLAIPCDVTDEARVAEIFAAAGSIDLLILAAGTGTFAPLADTTPAALRALLEVHAVGTLHCLRAALPGMRGRGRGHIIGIGSTAEHQTFADNAAYAAAKSAQSSLLRVLTEEVRPAGLHVTRVTLGAVDTPIWNDRPGFDRSRMMAPAQVAAAVVDLAADAAPPDALDLLPATGHL
ncbi:MAG TPA: SDR family oxidoreductase [Kofleriaceae bacterium]|jgi:NAD(P)-dependent dehydrogenase (short-subunit alcohol dehydrogenase family)|nr:SDR family oxidoreductase [Kofleriaceae bacterium]